MHKHQHFHGKKPAYFKQAAPPQGHGALEQVVRTVYQHLNLYNLRYQILATPEDCTPLTAANRFFVIPHVSGAPHIAVVCEHGTFLLDKKTLRFREEQTALKDVRYVQASTVSKRLAIFDGRLIAGDRFMLQDVIMYNGVRWHKRLDEKLAAIKQMLPEVQAAFGGTKVELPTLHTYDTVERLVFEVIPDMDEDVSGIIFVPAFTGKQYIFLCKEEFTKRKGTRRPTGSMEAEALPAIAAATAEDGEERVMELHATQMVDVYEVHEGGACTGVAFVPTMALSHRLQALFKQGPRHALRCRYVERCKKWQPLLE